jgi:hypothetical protein
LSQLINEPIHAFDNLPFLNSHYIKNAQLTELYGTIYTKLPGEMILKTTGFVQYQFDSLGQTTSMLSYRPHLAFIDSIHYHFQYSNARLTEIKALRKKDYSIQFFTYSNDKLSHTEERIGLLTTGEEIQTNSLSYVDEILGSNRLTNISYQGGNPYKNIRRTFDILNNLILEESIDYLSQDTITAWYTYDENSKLTHKKTMDGERLEELVISYQSNQEVEAIKYYTHGQLRKEIQIIYQAENQTLSSVIFLDHRSKLMEIIRF